MVARRKVVVVGAGPGGLAAAMQLAHAGCDVTVLERRHQVGGRTSAIEIDQYRFDCGPTFFLYPRVLSEIFRSVGRELMQDVPMKRLDPQYRLTFGQGGQLDCTPDMEEMDRQIAKFAPRDVGALRRYMDDNRVKLAKFRPILESPFNSPLDLMRPSLIAAAKHLHPFRSLGKELQRYFSDPRLVDRLWVSSEVLGDVAVSMSQPVQHFVVSGIRTWRLASDRWLQPGQRADGGDRGIDGSQVSPR